MGKEHHPSNGHDEASKGHDEASKGHDEASKGRDQVNQVLDVCLEWAGRGHGRSVTVIAIELDDLDTLRADPRIPSARDLLEVVGARLAKLQNVVSVRSGDTFVLVSTAPRSRYDAFSLADRAERTIARPLVIDAFEVTLTASIGVRVTRNGTRDGHMLLRDAHFALDEAKTRGRGEIVLFSSELRRRRMNARTDIQLQFEPVVSLGDGNVSTYEAAVVPGPTPGFGDADLATFELLLDELARTMTTWPNDVAVSFNVSPVQLLHRNFPDPVLAAAERYALERDRFVFEIDARDASQHLPAVQAVLTRLRDDGWRVGIDGVGSAISPLDTLALLPVQFVKIDRSLTEETAPEPWDLMTVSSAARALQIATVATGVETLPELALAIAHEYDFAQGSLFGFQLSAPAEGNSNRTDVP